MKPRTTASLNLETSGHLIHDRGWCATAERTNEGFFKIHTDRLWNSLREIKEVLFVTAGARLAVHVCVCVRTRARVCVCVCVCVVNSKLR